MSSISFRSKFALGVALACALPLGFAQQGPKTAGKGDYFMYVGTYTRHQSKGIYAWRFHAADGSVQPIGLVAETSNPSFLALAPNGRFLYAANEDSRYQGQPTGTVSAFAIDTATGKLTALNKVVSKGAGPCHVSVTPDGKFVFVANYNSGSIASFPVHPDGSLGDAVAFVQHTGSSVNPDRQAGPHAHSVVPSPDGRFLLSADLGLDEVTVYKIGSDGSLTPNNPPFAKVAPGSGPRHIAFGHGAKFVYVVSEMIPGITVFRYNASRGSLESIQSISSLPQGPIGNSSGAEIAVSADGKFVYSSNRGANSIAAFKIDRAKGTLTAAGIFPSGGRTPRNFAIDPSGHWLFAAHQDSDSIVKFRVDPQSGAISSAGQTLEAGAPVCIVFAAAH
ncbi:MAG TPA: lactonase family protein [Bryobacteraceae bacterium]|nr:lactonase family protein [Bryobacteraceae bacterium]